MFKNLYFANIFLVFIVYTGNSYSLEFSADEQKFSRQYLSSAIDSSNPNKVLVAILIASQLAQPDLLDKLYTQGSELGVDNILWLDQSIKKCLFSDQNMICDPSTSINNLKKLDQDNGLSYVYSAIYHARKNDILRAYKELNRAAKKKNYDDFYWKKFSTLLETLIKTGYPKKHLYTASVKYSHNMVTQPYQELMKLCNKQAKSSLEWKNSCIKVGELLEQKGTIFFANMVGFALQREALSIEKKDADRLARVKEGRELLNQWRIDAVKKLDFIEAQKKGPESYYIDLVKLGERKAIENALAAHNVSNEEHNQAKQ